MLTSRRNHQPCRILERSAVVVLLRRAYDTAVNEAIPGDMQRVRRIEGDVRHRGVTRKLQRQFHKWCRHVPAKPGDKSASVFLSLNMHDAIAIPRRSARRPPMRKAHGRFRYRRPTRHPASRTGNRALFTSASIGDRRAVTGTAPATRVRCVIKCPQLRDPTIQFRYVLRGSQNAAA